MKSNRKNMRTTLTLILILLSIATTNTYAQENVTTTTKQITLLLPDGKAIGFDKLDSIKKSWGADRVLFGHNEEDDRNGIMRLMRKSDEMQHEEAAHKKTLALMLNKPAPHFTLTDLNGREVNLASLKGKIVVLNFWFIGCAPCITEMPDLNRLSDQYKPSHVVFLAIGIDKASNIQAFLKKHEFKYQILPGAAATANSYNIYSYPTNIIIDTEGMVRMIAGSSAKVGELLRGEIDTLIHSVR
jgi:peroxiredoxin